MKSDPRRYGKRREKGRLYGYLYTLSLVILTGSAFGYDETTVKEMIRHEFPEVSQIPPDSLLVWQSKTRNVGPLLLDVRENEEYAVSHLKTARRSVSEQEALDILKNVPKDTLIVLYCSVGYRSSELAKKLKTHGFTNAHNLEGSIFEWANGGLPVFRGDRQVNAVHPFDKIWGKLLDRSLWATAPDSAHLLEAAPGD